MAWGFDGGRPRSAAASRRRPLGALDVRPFGGPRVLAALCVLSFASSSVRATEVDQAAFVCEVPDVADNQTLENLTLMNCEMVNRTIDDYNAAISEGKGFSDKQVAEWLSRASNASAVCNLAEGLLKESDADLQEAAFLAINAWGTIISGGFECCTLLGPPHCVTRQSRGLATAPILVPIGVLVLLFVASFLASWCLPKKREEKATLARDGTIWSGAALDPTARGPSRSFGELTAELRGSWLSRSCLRVLPNAAHFAGTSSSLFGALRDAFDFQQDSVRNQFEHLLSLWRSQCAMVADRSVEKQAAVEESQLLAEALGDLHAELLDGFCAWRERLRRCKRAGAPAPAGLPKMAGADGLWERGAEVRCECTRETADELSHKLAEVATFLLVWAEAGNLRFMPEVVYFITELALSADEQSLEQMYGSSQPGGHSQLGPYHSSLFLANVIRPIYNAIFDEWYDSVDVDPATKKDKKKLRSGFDNFLPADVANYDDWNEFFCDPGRLVGGLILIDGTLLFDLDHGERFSALRKVDWQVSLDASETKTHRELHSLWGVFASTHRVWLVHALMFLVGVCIVAGDAELPQDGVQPLLGREALVRFAAVGLLVPVHAAMWSFARWQVTGRAVRKQRRWAGGGILCAGRFLLRSVLYAAPLATYAAVRATHDDGFLEDDFNHLHDLALVAHCSVSAIGLFRLIFIPSTHRYAAWNLTAVPARTRVVRYVFWLVVLGLKFLMGYLIFRAVFDAIEDLNIAMIGRASYRQVSELYFTTAWISQVLRWLALWCTTWLLFVSDTQLWFTVVSTFLGVGTVFAQRGFRKAIKFSVEDAVAKIPERFSKKILPYSKAQAAISSEKEAAAFSPYFPLIWDRAMEYMRYEDKFNNQMMGDLSFRAGEAGSHVTWRQLQQPLGRGRVQQRPRDRGRVGDASRATGDEDARAASQGTRRSRVKVPDVFRQKGAFEIGFKHYCGIPDPHWPINEDVQWRIVALARGLGLPMPRPFRAPYIPGITVLIPHYGESILMQRQELFQESSDDFVPVIDWLAGKYAEEFTAFTSRMAVAGEWPVACSQWADYTDQQWDKVSAWSSMRMQTLWRTVGGMCLYHPALQCLYEAQKDSGSELARQGIWNPSDCFTCLVSMQMYKFFDKMQLAHTNRMFEKFPDCLKVAFIDCELKGTTAETDSVHPMQKRRYFSCLIDRTCAEDSEGRKLPKLRVELPGYPILGDGKGDNQNHAIPFMRGAFSQCIDANQGAYFEQMLMLPSALGEFRSQRRGDGLSKRIVGFPEHITSDIGSIGDFAASAEVAFGTILQRTYAVLGGRMHYGHPDIMNKLFMIQQGGVSKATKTLNLSEDIFAGMDFTLRGEDRKIRHCEYFHLAKGRDLGFNTVLGFFSKLSSGTGEQVITRQTFRLGQVLHLPEALTFYYAHAGYYFTQFLVSTSMPLLVFVWLLVLLSDCEGSFSAVTGCASADQPSAAVVMGEALGTWFSVLLLLFLVATSLPLFAEVWMERSLRTALLRFVKQMFTLSPLMFIFQAKIIGHYVINEIRYGGATYVSTGRGLPTERRPFVGEISSESGLRLKKVGGLFLDYAAISYYDGATLLAGAALVLIAGVYADAPSGAGATWIWVSLGLTIFSWLFAPFVFNPYQFDARHFCRDTRCLLAFFCEEGGKRWADWYERTQLKPRSGGGVSIVDVNFFLAFFFLAAMFESVNLKVEAFNKIYTERSFLNERTVVVLLPPLFASLAYSIVAVVLEKLLGLRTILRRRRKRPSMGPRARTSATLASRRAPTEQPSVAAERPEQSPRLLDAEEGQPEGELEGGEEPEEAADPELEVSEGEDNPEVEAHGRNEDREVARQRSSGTRGDGASELATPEPCCKGIPLAFSATLIVLLDFAEAVAALYDMYWIGWYNAFLAGLILKWGMLLMLLTVGEGFLRCQCCGACGFLMLPIQMWVKAHRMARDILVSSLIMAVLFPIVLLNLFNEKLCPGCSVHQLLIYRDPGHISRKEAVIVDMADEGSPVGGSDSLLAAELVEAGGARASSPPPAQTMASTGATRLTTL